jgi:hypothetical protein
LNAAFEARTSLIATMIVFRFRVLIQIKRQKREKITNSEDRI